MFEREKTGVNESCSLNMSPVFLPQQMLTPASMSWTIKDQVSREPFHFLSLVIAVLVQSNKNFGKA